MEREGGLPTPKHRWEPGFAVLRGGKEGLDCTSSAINLKLSIQLCPDQSPGALASGQEIWTVDITDLQPGRSPEQEHRDFWCQQWTCCMLSIFPVFTCCYCCCAEYRAAIGRGENGVLLLMREWTVFGYLCDPRR